MTLRKYFVAHEGSHLISKALDMNRNSTNWFFRIDLHFDLRHVSRHNERSRNKMDVIQNGNYRPWDLRAC